MNKTICTSFTSRIAFIVSLILMSTCAQSQKFPLNCNYWGVFDTCMLTNNNYLTADLLERKYGVNVSNFSKLENDSTYMSLGMYAQVLGTYYTFEGENNKAQILFDTLFHKTGIDSLNRFTSLPLDSLKHIGEKNHFVLFNEAHHVPQGRYLVGSLLQSYYDLGFRYLGLEALWKDSLQTRGYLSIHDGCYTREPVMGNLIREAKKMGYTVFPYDIENQKKHGREEAEADNIFSNTRAKDANAKVLILAGWGHIDEDSISKMMAYYLNKDYGINPFTIDQTLLRSRKNIETRKPEIYITNQLHDTRTNLQIYNNLTLDNNCFSLRKCKEIKIKLPSNSSLHLNRILLVYYEDEISKSKDAVPTYTHVLKPDQRIIPLRLGIGKYRVLVKDEMANTVYQKSIQL